VLQRRRCFAEVGEAPTAYLSRKNSRSPAGNRIRRLSGLPPSLVQLREGVRVCCFAFLLKSSISSVSFDRISHSPLRLDFGPYRVSRFPATHSAIPFDPKCRLVLACASPRASGLLSGMHTAPSAGRARRAAASRAQRPVRRRNRRARSSVCGTVPLGSRRCISGMLAAFPAFLETG
jgi:hypothetical protein